MTPEAAREELSRRADAIEGGYEMMLAYAAQGLATDQGAANSNQLRDHLQRFDAALTGLAQTYRECAAALSVGPTGALNGFLKTLEADAADDAGGLAAGAGTGRHQLADDRQHQCVDSRPRAAHRRLHRR